MPQSGAENATRYTAGKEKSPRHDGGSMKEYKSTAPGITGGG
nr:MAG TPA: hypothetical protein [Caudoviricetes sp.]